MLMCLHQTISTGGGSGLHANLMQRQKFLSGDKYKKNGLAAPINNIIDTLPQIYFICKSSKVEMQAKSLASEQMISIEIFQ